jgi:5-hydroxyisourate hydrolase-like protein (transthyretin family)
MRLAAAIFLSLLLQTQSAGILRGQVVDWSTGTPIADATITLTGEQAKILVRHTDSEGRFEVEGLAEGHQVLRVNARGYVLREGIQSLAGSDYRDVEVAFNQPAELRLEMVAAGTITGTVRDVDDRPLAGKQVTAFRRQFDTTGKPSLIAAGMRSETDTDGRYLLTGLPFGEYFLRVDDRTPIYYPDTTDPRDVLPVRIDANASSLSGIDLQARPYRPVQIRGVAIDADDPSSDNPMDTLYMVPAGGENVERRYQDDSSDNRNSHFELKDVAPGSYDLVVSLIAGGRRYFGTVHLEVGTEDVNDVRVLLYPATNLRARVLVRGDAPPFDLSKLRVMVVPNNEFSSLSARLRISEGSVDAEGNVLISQVTPYESRLVVTGLPPTHYVDAERLDNEDVLGENFIVPSSGSTLDIVIAGPAGTVQGTVVTSQGDPPVEPLMVVLAPLQSGGRDFSQTVRLAVSSLRGGSFGLAGVAPGRYELLAFTNANSGFPYYNEQFLRQYEAQATVITVEPGKTVQTVVTAITIKP